MNKTLNRSKRISRPPGTKAFSGRRIRDDIKSKLHSGMEKKAVEKGRSGRQEEKMESFRVKLKAKIPKEAANTKWGELEGKLSS